MTNVDRITVKARVHTDAPRIDSVVDLFPGADFPEREVYDMFGVVFDGHPDMRRILMPEDYEGHPQRRDFPIGGEPVLFTYNEEQLREVAMSSGGTPVIKAEDYRKREESITLCQRAGWARPTSC